MLALIIVVCIAAISTLGSNSADAGGGMVGNHSSGLTTWWMRWTLRCVYRLVVRME